VNLSFAASPVSGAISTDGEVDCYPIEGLTSGEHLAVAFHSNSGEGMWSITDELGDQICSGFSGGGECQLSGPSNWYLSVLAADGSSTFNYSLGARKLTNPEGCSPLPVPGIWSFSAGTIGGTIEEGLAAHCYTFTRKLGESDSAYWFQAIRSTGTLQPAWHVYNPIGALVCGGVASGFNRCPLQESGQFTVTIEDSSESETGSYALSAKRLTAREGCSSLSSLAFNASPVEGSVAATGQVDCYSLSAGADGERLHVGLQTASGSSAWTIVDGEGNEICSGAASAECELSGSSGWSVLVESSDGRGNFEYSLAVRKLADPEGCASLGAPGAWSFASAALVGSIESSLGARCYTFTRKQGEADGAYWFQSIRTTGLLQPQWHVYDPSGALVCGGGPGVDVESCAIQEFGQFAVVVEDSSQAQTGSFELITKRLTEPSGCASVASLGLSSASTEASIGVPGEIDCYSLSNAKDGQRLQIGLQSSSGTPMWAVVDGAGDRVCSGTSSGECRLSGSSGWSVLVEDSGARETYDYSLALRRLDDPEGCSSLGDPGVWSFTAAAIAGTIEGPLHTRCYTFTRKLGEADSDYWFQAIRTSGELQPQWRVYDPDGALVCQGSGAGFNSCPVREFGQFAVVVEDSSQAQAGSFELTAKRLNEPTGCATLPSLAFGIKPTLGNLSADGEIDCYSLPATLEDQLEFNLTGAADRYTVLDAAGEPACNEFARPCVMAGEGPYSLMVYSAGGTTRGNYHFEATCENVPCGQADTEVTDAVPSRVGANPYVTLLLRGHDLELLEGASSSPETTSSPARCKNPPKTGEQMRSASTSKAPQTAHGTSKPSSSAGRRAVSPTQ
jgi:hypothetical protein